MGTLLTILTIIVAIALIGAIVWAIAMIRFVYVLWRTTRDLEGDHLARRR